MAHAFNHLEIKHLTFDRVPEVLALDHLCFGGLWTEAGYQREIDSPNSNLLILEASQQNLAKSIQIPHARLQVGPTTAQVNPAALIGLGCVWFVLEEAHITILGIDPHYRHQGLGRLMLITLLKAAMKRGSEWATLEVRRSNTIAQTLYHRVGFTVIGQRKRYYPDTNEDALIFWHRGLQETSFAEKLATIEQNVYDQIKASGWTMQSIFTPSTPHTGQ
ncbi:MAG: ribosomal protein S18-alanine N-acetyltransferase [Leptolyngbyaceae bacterium]|nr:ribosomal protein S18-alanine N-acetyltransferase [Leptolyngbyaceae bacterium]